MILYDPAKNAANIVKHGLALSEFTGFDSRPAVEEDIRWPYGERRFRAFGYVEGQRRCLVYSPRGLDIRLISFARLMRRRCDAMDSDPLDPDWDDNPEWTAEDFARARPADEVHPPHIVRQLVRPSAFQAQTSLIHQTVLARHAQLGSLLAA